MHRSYAKEMVEIAASVKVVNEHIKSSSAKVRHGRTLVKSLRVTSATRGEPPVSSGSRKRQNRSLEKKENKETHSVLEFGETLPSGMAVMLSRLSCSICLDSLVYCGQASICV